MGKIVGVCTRVHRFDTKINEKTGKPYPERCAVSVEGLDVFVNGVVDDGIINKEVELTYTTSYSTAKEKTYVNGVGYPRVL